MIDGLQTYLEADKQSGAAQVENAYKVYNEKAGTLADIVTKEDEASNAASEAAKTETDNKNQST